MSVLRELPEIGVMLGKLFADVAPVKVSLSILSAIVAYFLPTEAQQAAGLAAAYCIVLDTVTGVVAARVSGKPITSAKLGRVLVKLLAYASVLSVVATAVNHVPGANVAQGPSVTGVLTFILLTESVSILENVRLMGLVLPFGLESWLAGRMPQKEEPK